VEPADRPDDHGHLDQVTPDEQREVAEAFGLGQQEP
jgi:hypothetical protein